MTSLASVPPQIPQSVSSSALVTNSAAVIVSELVIWATAEPATTVMAASIPVLRVLFRDLVSSTDRYYGSTIPGRSVLTGTRHATTSAADPKGGGLRSHARLRDDASERSILGDDLGASKGIIHTTEFTLEVNDQGSKGRSVDGETEAYEMT